MGCGPSGWEKGPRLERKWWNATPLKIALLILLLLFFLELAPFSIAYPL